MVHAMPRKRDLPHNAYLLRRGRTWFVRKAIPPRLRAAIGKQEIVRSLRTHDVVEARERRWEALAAIQRELTKLEEYPEDVVRRALEDRQWYLAASDRPRSPDTDMTPREEISCILDDFAEEIEERQGLEAARRYMRIATSKTPPLSLVAEQWFRDLEGQVTNQTLSQHRLALDLLLKRGSRDDMAGEISRREAGDFIEEVLKPGRRRKTVNRLISSLSAFWKWMIKRGFADANPWQGQGDFRQRRRNQENNKRPYTKEELLNLLAADPAEIMGERYGPALSDLLRLGLMTGARLDELCELRVVDVDEQLRALKIPKGKTASAIRVIPVHASVWPIVEGRLKLARDGYLFGELKPGGPDQKRSWYMSKRFGVFRRRVLGDDNAVDFHSLRRSFATYLDNAQGLSLAVHPSAIAELMGHAKGSLALSLYSGGKRIQYLRDAIDALSLVIEPEVMNAVTVPAGPETHHLGSPSTGKQISVP
jgi:integrase